MRIFLYDRGTGINAALMLTIIYLLAGCTAAKSQKAEQNDIRLKYLNQYTIPRNFQFDNTTVGGLSGIEYDANEDVYYAISDDRSQIDPARFYTFNMPIRNGAIDTVVFLKKEFLKNASGKNFPAANTRTATVYPEALRRWQDKVIWSSEGQRTVNDRDTVLLNPQVFIATLNGNYMDTFVIPTQVRISATETGVRNNGGFEGLDVSPDGKYLYVSVEEPLLQDGPRAGLGDSTGIVRIIKFDMLTRQPLAQYAYKIEAVAHPVFPPNAFRINGISDIMCLGDDKLMVVERSFSFGRLSCTIRVFVADLKDAEDVSHLSSLKNASYKQLPKKLVINMDDLGIYIGNIEGVTFGSTLPNGKRSLIFIADDNFNAFETNQILLFEVER